MAGRDKAANQLLNQKEELQVPLSEALRNMINKFRGPVFNDLT